VHGWLHTCSLTESIPGLLKSLQIRALMSIRTRIRLSILMPIRILPQVLHMLEYKIKNLLLFVEVPVYILNLYRQRLNFIFNTVVWTDVEILWKK
jgi:hypothetical protein